MPTEDENALLDFYRFNSTTHKPNRVAGPGFVPTVEITEFKGEPRKATIVDVTQDPRKDVTAPPKPTITSVTPNQGPLAGNTTVAIVGTNFIPTSKVKFGGVAELPGGTYTDHEHITSKTPPHAAGSIDVDVINAEGNPPLTPPIKGTLVNGYTYTGGLLLNPYYGFIEGGVTITITNGANFAVGTTVTFDGIAATNIVIINDTSLRCTNPAHAAGYVTVLVHNTVGPDLMATNGFKYQIHPYSIYWTTSGPPITPFGYRYGETKRIYINITKQVGTNLVPYTDYIGFAYVTVLYRDPQVDFLIFNPSLPYFSYVNSVASFSMTCRYYGPHGGSGALNFQAGDYANLEVHGEGYFACLGL